MQCYECRILYKGKKGLCPHVKIARRFYCDYCSYSTRWKSNLGQHFNAKHNMSSESQKPYKCETCKKTYFSQGSLYNHRKFECGKEPSFFCHLCNFSSKLKTNLQKHMKNLHDANDAKPRFNCTKCGRSYKYKSGLTEHIKYKCFR